MQNTKNLEGYELIEQLNKGIIPEGTIITAHYKGYHKAGELVVKKDISEIYYVCWIDEEEVGCSLFTDNKLEFSYELK